MGRWVFAVVIGLGFLPAILMGGAAGTGGAGAGRGMGVGGATASAPAPELTEEKARFALRAMAMAHYDPYIRQAGYAQKEGDWTIDVAKKTFSMMVREPEARRLEGTFYDNTGRWYAKFTDDEKLTAPWMPPQDAKLSLEEARAALAAMCALPEQPDVRVKGFGSSLAKVAVDEASKEKGIVLREPGAGIANGGVVWKIDLEKRTFTVEQIIVDFGYWYSGAFGWDKDKHWAAWPRSAMTVGGVFPGGRR